MSNNSLLNPIIPVVAKGLNDWLPEEHFNRPHNIKSFNRILDVIGDINVSYSPTTNNCYIVGPDGIAYSSINNEVVRFRGDKLYQQYSRGTKVPGLAFSDRYEKLSGDSQRANEEARARSLHICIGVACLRLAAHAESAADFKKYSSSAIKVLNEPYQHTGKLGDLDLSESGHTLFYHFKRAAIQHKTMSEEQTKLFQSGIEKTASDGGVWLVKAGTLKLFKDITTDEKKLITEPSSIPTRNTHTNRIRHIITKEFVNSGLSAIIYDSQWGDLKTTPFSRYASSLRLTDHSLNMTPEQQLALLYKKHLGPDKMKFKHQVGNEKFISINYGVQAYLRAASNHDTARQILETISPLKTTDLNAILVAGNLITEKINLNNKNNPNKAKRALPGFGARSVSECFEAIRDSIYSENGIKEEYLVKMLGDIIKEHISQTFSSYEDTILVVPSKGLTNNSQ